jgi:hypothetical protein
VPCLSHIKAKLDLLEKLNGRSFEKKYLLLVENQAASCLSTLRKDKVFNKFILYQPKFGDLNLESLADHYNKPTIIMTQPEDQGEIFSHLLTVRNLDSVSISPTSTEALVDDLLLSKMSH